ncbi:CBS domain-containing protein CBSCBSPB1 [Sesamum angolense]|uniref:CBS domain-containing protein CBSCBSPB1 n=1 Tax=Sesamum angolense TaxID=2727404 RepID=A0AAE1XF05_9LAMI|nr:CBS domain-containing protein CBSCBSPB1 [Sesamum angolense]
MTTSQFGGSSSRRSRSLTTSTSRGRKKAAARGGDVLDSPSSRRSLTASRSMGLTGERTVKRLRLSRALTVPETTSIKEACRKMASRRVDALLLTDANALLCGILTDKDIATRVIAREVNIDETHVSKVMTRNPVFVLSDTLAVEALQKMVQGKFRHLPVVENGEVIALLDITKCLYDAIARMERVAEKGKAIAAAVEGVEKQWGTSVSGWVVTIDPSETVLAAAKKILEFRTSSAVVIVENKPRGILTSKDMLMRVIAQDLPPESTLVEKVMTPNPECATIDSPIVDALHIMHDGKFLHLPVVDRDGQVITVVDVLNITHAAVATVGSTAGVSSEAANMMMQNFWDSAMALTTDNEDETRSENSFKVPSDGGETGRSVPQPSSTTSDTFSFKIQDGKGRMHRFICVAICNDAMLYGGKKKKKLPMMHETQNVTDLVTAILQRVGADIDRNNLPQIMYEDEEHDKVVLASDSDLQAAIYHAKLSGWKGLRLHLEYLKAPSRLRRVSNSESMGHAQADASASAYGAVAAGAALVAGLSVYAFLKRTGN